MAICLFLIVIGSLLTLSSQQLTTDSEQIAVEGVSTNIVIRCNLGRQEDAPFWFINGSAYELFSIPQDFLSGVIPVISSFSVLEIPIVTLDLDETTFQCATFDETGLVNGSITRLIVIRNSEPGVKSPPRPPENTLLIIDNTLDIEQNAIRVEWTVNETDTCGGHFELQGYTLANIQNSNLETTEHVVRADSQFAEIPTDQLTTSDRDPVYYRLVAVNESGVICSHVQTETGYFRFDASQTLRTRVLAPNHTATCYDIPTTSLCGYSYFVSPRVNPEHSCTCPVLALNSCLCLQLNSEFRPQLTNGSICFATSQNKTTVHYRCSTDECVGRDECFISTFLESHRIIIAGPPSAPDITYNGSTLCISAYSHDEFPVLSYDVMVTDITGIPTSLTREYTVMDTNTICLPMISNEVCPPIRVSVSARNEIGSNSSEVLFPSDVGNQVYCTCYLEREQITVDVSGDSDSAIAILSCGLPETSALSFIVESQTGLQIEQNLTCGMPTVLSGLTSETTYVLYRIYGERTSCSVGNFTTSMEISGGQRAAECTISEPLLVSPFNSPAEYTVRGTCELIALMSCNGTEPGFVVRVDFLSDSEANGAVGVYMGDLKWISREDGMFSSDVEASLSANPDVLEYPAHNIRVTINMTGERTEVEVGGDIRIVVVHKYGNEGSISISVGSGSSLVESCGICGTQSGQLLSLNGDIATNPTERQVFVESYRLPARDMSLRPARPECNVIRNDTIIGDPLFLCRIYSSNQELNMCYEVHGHSNSHFNLVSDACVSVNAFFSPIRDLNIISSIGVRAEGDDGVCRNIRVDLDGCTLSTGTSEDTMIPLNEFSVAGVSARKARHDRVRISVPNCENVQLVMWLTCELDMMRFRIARGVNLRPTSHGLLGQFWNIPVVIQPFTPQREELFVVTVIPPDSPPRSFLGDLYPRTWDNNGESCLYVGNGQAGPVRGDTLKGSVIQGRYTDYIMKSMFDMTFKYRRMNDKCAV